MRNCTKCQGLFVPSPTITEKLGHEQKVCADCALVAVCTMGNPFGPVSGEFDRSISMVAANNPARGLYYRLRVWRSPFDITNLVEEQVTSANPTAEVIDDGERSRILLTRQEVRWLHAQLGELVQIIDAEDATETKE